MRVQALLDRHRYVMRIKTLEHVTEEPIADTCTKLEAGCHPPVVKILEYVLNSSKVSAIEETNVNSNMKKWRIWRYSQRDRNRRAMNFNEVEVAGLEVTVDLRIQVQAQVQLLKIESNRCADLMPKERAFKVATVSSSIKRKMAARDRRIMMLTNEMEKEIGQEVAAEGDQIKEEEAGIDQNVPCILREAAASLKTLEIKGEKEVDLRVAIGVGVQAKVEVVRAAEERQRTLCWVKW